MQAERSIRVADVTRRFGATVALNKAALEVTSGHVHALLGENGAGKSTMVKLLSGLLRPDSGTIEVFGKTASITSPRRAHELGIQTAFQEMTLLPDLTVTQNMLLPYEPVTVSGQLRPRRAAAAVAEQLRALGMDDVDPRSEVRDLELPVRQKLEIAKAISRRPRILLLDEPTSSLTGANVDWLGRIIGRLAGDGVTIIFITHRMQEVRRFCHSLSVFRNGRRVGAFEVGEISDPDIVQLMIGRALTETFPPRPQEPRADRQPVLSGRCLGTERYLHDVSFDLHAGEILGIGALQAMGQVELFQSLFGVTPLRRGEILLDGRAVTIASPKDAVSRHIGISFLPEDRKTEGLFLKMTGCENASLPIVHRFSTFGWLHRRREEAQVDRMLSRVNVHPRALYKPCASFSGGNQQKIALAKWLLTGNRILLMFDPTRGVDVGTKHEIFVLMREFAQAGGAILFYSTDIAELDHMCDRVLVLYRGRIARELTGAAITETDILEAELGQAAAGDTVTDAETVA